MCSLADFKISSNVIFFLNVVNLYPFLKIMIISNENIIRKCLPNRISSCNCMRARGFLCTHFLFSYSYLSHKQISQNSSCTDCFESLTVCLCLFCLLFTLAASCLFCEICFRVILSAIVISIIAINSYQLSGF